LSQKPLSPKKSKNKSRPLSEQRSLRTRRKPDVTESIEPERLQPTALSEQKIEHKLTEEQETNFLSGPFLNRWKTSLEDF
jgi:hypothetical protein